MTYVTREDYLSRISDDLIDIITEKISRIDTNILFDANKTAEDEIRNFLGGLFDIEPELAKTGTDRNYSVLGWAVNIALYIVYQRVPDHQVPEKVIKNYDDTMTMLDKISEGKKRLGLPRKVQEDGDNTSSTIIRISSKPPRGLQI